MTDNTSRSTVQNQRSSDAEQSVLDLSDRKIDIALAQLAERYTALHNMRDRSMQFTIWILGLGLALAWLLLSEIALTPIQSRALLTLLVVIPFASHLFLRGISIGFKNNMAIARRLERTLLLREPGAYLTATPILEEKFAGQRPPAPKHLLGRIIHSIINIKLSGHFFTLNCLLITVFLSLFLLTLANPCGRQKSQGPSQPNIEQSSEK